MNFPWRQHPGRARSALVVGVCAATTVLLLLTGPGGATPAGATGLSIGAGSTVQLGDALLALGCNDLDIAPAGTLRAQASTIRLAGNWDNRGTFDPGTGTVVFEDGCALPETSSIGGSDTFFDLRIITSDGKTVRFEAGDTQTVLDSLTLMGAPGNLLVIRSSMAGRLAFLDLGPAASRLVDYIDVADNTATGQLVAPGPPAASHSIDAGNTTGWFSVLTAAAPAASGLALAGALVVLLAVGGIMMRRTRPIAGEDPPVSE